MLMVSIFINLTCDGCAYIMFLCNNLPQLNSFLVHELYRNRQVGMSTRAAGRKHFGSTQLRFWVPSQSCSSSFPLAPRASTSTKRLEWHCKSSEGKANGGTRRVPQGKYSVDPLEHLSSVIYIHPSSSSSRLHTFRISILLEYQQNYSYDSSQWQGTSRGQKCQLATRM